MSKTRIQNQLRKLIKLQKDKLTNAIPEMIKNYLINGKPIANKKILTLANDIGNSIKESIENNLLPSMPSESWMNEHGSVSEPLGYKGE